MNGRNHLRTIDLAAIAHNVRVMRAQTPETARLLAVVKADAYGHGSLPVARKALEAGASFLAVAIPEEGAELRAAGIAAPILVLGAATPGAARIAAACGLTLTVCAPEMVAFTEAAAAKAGVTVDVHLKLDTGMSRIGCRTKKEVAAMLAALSAAPHVRLTGAFTHFADADGDTPDFTRTQFARFQALTADLPQGIIRHCANSATIHRYPEMALDMVRMGISLYGYPPCPTDGDLRPAMRWTAEITYIKTIEPEDTVSYGRTFRAQKPLRVATVACGYGDGYHRAATGKAQVLVNGRRCPVIGRICMDQFMVDVTEAEAAVGDEAVLLGRSGSETIDAEDLARWAGTISYEILLAATGRVQRVWLHE